MVGIKLFTFVVLGLCFHRCLAIDHDNNLDPNPTEKNAVIDALAKKCKSSSLTLLFDACSNESKKFVSSCPKSCQKYFAACNKLTTSCQTAAHEAFITLSSTNYNNIFAACAQDIVPGWFSMGEERPEYLKQPLVQAAFAKIAAASPEKKCLHYEEGGFTKWLSYGEVNSRANTLAGQLSALGVEPGVVVGLMLDRSFELVVSMLAVFKAGGCYLPCDPTYPDDLLKTSLEDGKAMVLLTQKAHFERASTLVGNDVRVLDVKKLSQDNGGQKTYATAPLKPPSPEDPAYLIFTSGSTGRPKGVLIPHRALRDHLEGSAEYYNMTSDDVGLFAITINFDPHLMQVFVPLIVGAGLVIAREGHMDAAYITSVIKKQGVTHYVLTPSLALVQFAADARECTTLRCAMVGGEPLPREVITLFAKRMPWCKVYNVYGPTETSVTATEIYAPLSTDVITIGRPVYNLQSFIVDAALRPVPVGVPGELLLSGPRLALGYVRRPDSTKKKFIPNPFFDLIRDKVAPELLPYSRKAYRTGDLVRWRSDGNIQFLRRLDRQVKINGTRVELGDVEAAMKSAAGVTQAVAAMVADPSHQKRLVGYVVPETINHASVIAHCRSLLVPGTAPSVVISLKNFPLLPNGKIDVKSLPAPDW
jgi:amino acid adenylation domain-containing protein